MRYVVTGRVHPERADLNFHAEWAIAEGHRIRVTCEASQLCVVLEDAQIDGYVTAFVNAEHFAQTVTSAYGFSLGSGYSVELIQVIEDGGQSHVFGVRPEGLKFDAPQEIFQRAFLLASENLFFRLALRDYVRAVVDTTDCATYCYRAVEALRSAFAFQGAQDGWAEMHRVLRTDRDQITVVIKDFADPVRHGNWAAARVTNGAQRLAMLVLTRDILARYLDYGRPAAAAQAG
jgi:hypothetical protein